MVGVSTLDRAVGSALDTNYGWWSPGGAPRYTSIPKCIPKNPQSFGPLNVAYRSCSKNFTQILNRRHDWCIKLSKDHGNLSAFSCCLTRLICWRFSFLTQLAMGNTTSDAAANQPTPLLKKGGQDRNNIMVSWTDFCYFFASLERRNFFFFGIWI